MGTHYALVALGLAVLMPFDPTWVSAQVTQATSRRQKSLAEVRQEFLGADVVVLGNKYSSPLARQDCLLAWGLGYGEPGSLSEKTTECAPYTYKGQRGKVLAIQLVRSPISGAKEQLGTDVFGEKVKEDDIVNPYSAFFVKMDSGTILTVRGYPTTISHQFELASIIDNERQQISERLESLIGRFVYPVAYSRVFSPDADLSKMTDLRPSRNLVLTYANLTPLKITRTKYVDAEHAILAKVESSDGRSGIIFGRFNQFGRLQPQGAAGKPFLEQAIPGVLASIPDTLTSVEVDAIRRGAVLNGMSKQALHYSIGLPEKENDWGGGGKQLIYANGRIVVYLRGEKVVDWQSLAK